MREKVYINDKIWWFIDTVFPQDWINDRPKLVCPVCNEEFETSDQMYIIMTDNKLFPNCFIHRLCSSHNFEDTAKNIMLLYNEYKECIRKHKAWV